MKRACRVALLCSLASPFNWLTQTPVASVSAGDYHSCAVTTLGKAYCWGANGFGELGVGTSGDVRRSPAAVIGTATFASTATGQYHTCGVTTVGAALCWGSNSAGQLGIGASAGGGSPSPALVVGGLVFATVTTGANHSCGITTGGAFYCWGDNQYGELGDGTTTPWRSSPVPVAAPPWITQFTSLSSGGSHTCGVTATHQASCWGSNGSGQLGVGSTAAQRLIPAAVTGAHGFLSISVGNAHSCGLQTDGAVYCWGANTVGQLGVPIQTTQSRDPMPVTGTVTFASLDAGWDHSCGLKSDGTAFCWGNNSSGQLGDGTAITPRPGPVPVAGTNTFKSLSAGGAHTCGVRRADGAALCWGSNNVGQLGNPPQSIGGQSRSPVAVSGGHTFVSVSAGSSHSCGVAADGTVYCWGDNGAGQLGTGNNVPAGTPVAVGGLTGLTFASVSAGTNYTCAATTSGAAYCWGTNTSGQLGDGTTAPRLSPVLVSGGLAFASLSAGFAHTCGITTAGTEYCWGQGGFGQVGDGTTLQRLAPVTSPGGQLFLTGDAGPGYTCGVTTGHDLYCWGNNGQGELGDGTTTPRRNPTQASGFGFESVSAGWAHACGIVTSGWTYCWGNNMFGELGDGTTTPKLTPGLVSGAIWFASVSAGYEQTCGTRVGGGVYCWGGNASGVLGTGSTIDAPTPVAVQGGMVLASVSSGAFHGCGVTAGGAAYCWGENWEGELGDGTSSGSYLPVRVVLP